MQVNNKSLFFILGIIVILLFVFGCTTEPKSSISGKITIGGVEEGFIFSSGSTEISTSNLFNKKRVRDLELEFVPDEIIVKYKPGVNLSLAAKSIADSGYTVKKTPRKIGNGSVTLLKLENMEKALNSKSYAIERTLLEIERLNSLPTVEYAEPNYIYRTLFSVDDFDSSLQWHYPLIRLDKVWQSLSELDDLSSITVAVIDTGIGRTGGGFDHEDLDGIFIDEYDFIDNDFIATDTDGNNTGFHGTHVAGTIGALTNNNIGVAGVAGGNNSGVKIMPLRVLDGNGGTSDVIAQAILYAAQLENDSNELPTKKADVINLSIGSNFNSRLLAEAITAAYDNGVILVAAAGNESSIWATYPAAYPNVISVAAVGLGAERAYYSNYGDTIDIAAPGGTKRFDFDLNGEVDQIFSTLFQDGPDTYGYLTGTSMAAPHVAGAAAIVLKGIQVKTGSTDIPPSIVKDILTSTAIDLGNSDYYGAGLINVYAAACEALGKPQGAMLYPFPKTIRLENKDTTGSFILKNIGDSGSINISSINVRNQYSPPLISGITPNAGFGSVDLNNSLEIQVSLNITGKQNGTTYSALLEIIDDGANKEYVSVIYKHIGDVYVTAYDIDTGKSVAGTVTNFERGYEYVIEGLDAGQYVIGAATDRNEDENYFNQQEANGYFLNNKYLKVIDLKEGSHIKNIDFSLVENSPTNY